MDDAPAAARPPSGGGGAASSTGLLAGAEWPARLADLVEAVVAGVHDKVVRPLVIVARAVVFGVLVGAMALVIAVLCSIAVVRLLDAYAFGRRVWASDLVVGGFFALVGLVAWSRRHAGRAEER
jgi:hypothetical protein